MLQHVGQLHVMTLVLFDRRTIKSTVFFKQTTAYEFRLSLVGSEKCISDRGYDEDGTPPSGGQDVDLRSRLGFPVIYTHLTLPTNRLGEILDLAVSMT